MSDMESKTRSLHSIRVYDRLAEICNNTGLPLSNIAEVGLVHFCKMSDEERIKYLVDNDPDKTDFSSLKDPEFDYAETAIGEAKLQFGDKFLGRMSVKAIIAIGLLILAGIFFSANQKDN